MPVRLPRLNLPRQRDGYFLTLVARAFL